MSDAQETSIPVDWIIPEVKSILEGEDVSSAITPQGVRDRLYNLDVQVANARRGLIINVKRHNSIKLV